MQATARSQRLVVVVLLGAFLVGGALVHRYWAHELSHLTGRASWIWVTDDLVRVHPAAALFVARLNLRVPPVGALLKVCGDREYVAYVNGTPAGCGWSRPGFRLDLYDVAHLLRQGENLIAVEVRSPTPVGGLLCAVDVDNVGRNILVSGESFACRRSFSLAENVQGEFAPPVDWGDPPRYPWDYPRAVPHPRTLDEMVVEDPIRVARRSARAMARGVWEFDLPRPTFGYLWLDYGADGGSFVASTADGAGLDANQVRDLARPVIRLPGERRWLCPEPRTILKVYVFGAVLPDAVELWPVSEDLIAGAPGVVPSNGAVKRPVADVVAGPPE